MLKKRGNGGETGIRTLGTLTRTMVFETTPFDHSGTSPMAVLATQTAAVNQSKHACFVDWHLYSQAAHDELDLRSQIFAP